MQRARFLHTWEMNLTTEGVFSKLGTSLGQKKHDILAREKRKETKLAY